MSVAPHCTCPPFPMLAGHQPDCPLAPPPILPSSLRAGDVIHWKTETGVGTARVVRVYVNACLLGFYGGPVLSDEDAARLAIKIVRRGTT